MPHAHPSHADLPVGVQNLIDQATKSEAGPSRQRKHHLVPRSYLERWADGGTVILFPLAPNALLALFRKGTAVEPPFELDHAETAEVNREIIANATRWAFERGTLQETLTLTVPSLPTEPTITEGPLPRPGVARPDRISRVPLLQMGQRRAGTSPAGSTLVVGR